MNAFTAGDTVRIANNITWLDGHHVRVVRAETRHGLPGYLVNLAGEYIPVWIPAHHLEPAKTAGGAS